MEPASPSCQHKLTPLPNVYVGLWTLHVTLCRMPSEVSSQKEHAQACSMHVDGPIAQLVEQLAFNQWVAGSSPARLTT